MLAVSDTGVGIRDEVRAHLFEPFFTTKESGSGTGLGLSMVYGAVKQNGGHIEVYSEMGHGATFKIFLPAVHEQPDVASEVLVGPRPRGVRDHRSRRRRGARPDHRLIDAQAARLLRSCFPDGPSAIAAVETMTEDLHLLITDVVMPRMNGQVLTQRLLELRPTMQVLFTSGYTSNVIVHHGVLNEGVEFLPKPVLARAACAPRTRGARQTTAIGTDDLARARAGA